MDADLSVLEFAENKSRVLTSTIMWLQPPYVRLGIIRYCRAQSRSEIFNNPGSQDIVAGKDKLWTRAGIDDCEW